MTLRWREPDLLDDFGVDDRLLGYGWDLSRRAALYAPKDTGAGAASIHPERIEHGHVRVSWDRQHFYMSFHELGTEKMPPHPFLRPAAQEMAEG